MVENLELADQKIYVHVHFVYMYSYISNPSGNNKGIVLRFTC